MVGTRECITEDECPANTPQYPYIRRLGEVACCAEPWIIGRLELLARAGLPVPEGAVLTRRAHEKLLRTSFASGETAARGRAGMMRGSHGIATFGEDLKAGVCEALIELRARSVRVISEYGVRAGLQTIPEALDAVRSVWLSPEGLERRVLASAAGEEAPTRPVLVKSKPSQNRCNTGVEPDSAEPRSRTLGPEK